jgi:hypothetical protein
MSKTFIIGPLSHPLENSIATELDSGPEPAGCLSREDYGVWGSWRRRWAPWWFKEVAPEASTSSRTIRGRSWPRHVLCDLDGRAGAENLRPAMVDA